MSYSNALNRGANVLIGYVFGAVYLLVGLLGFTVSGGHDFAGMDGGKLLGLFMVNPLHNVAHLLIGALLVLAATRGEAVSSRVNTVVGGVYLLRRRGLGGEAGSSGFDPFLAAVPVLCRSLHLPLLPSPKGA